LISFDPFGVVLHHFRKALWFNWDQMAKLPNSGVENWRIPVGRVLKVGMEGRVLWLG
jgi:hypothetical protein